MSDDWSQNRAIRNLSETLEAQAAAASARQRALDRRIQALQGDLTSQVTTLTHQLNALIEQGDLRDELTLYIPMRRARDAAIALTRAVLHGDGDLTFLRESPDLVGDSDYWLVSAALAIVDARDGTLDDDAVATALRLDRGRAAPFLVAVTTLVGHPELTSHLLPDCFTSGFIGAAAQSSFGSAEPSATPAAPQPAASTRRGRRPQAEAAAADPVISTGSPDLVSHTERLLWRAAAAGMLGAGAVRPVQRALVERVALAHRDQWGIDKGDLVAHAPQLGFLTSAGPDPLGTLGTEAILGTWATWAERMATHEIREQRAVAAAPFGRAAADPSSTAGPSGTADPSSTAGEVEQIQRGLDRVVLSLASEGGPRERELLQRIDLLGARLGKVANTEPQWWAGSAGPVVLLVATDAQGSDPDAAALVAPLVTPVLSAAIDRHRDSLLATPPPTQTVKLGSRIVTVSATDDGAAAAWQAREAFHGQPLPGPNLLIVGILTAVGAIAAVLALTSGQGAWWWLTILALGLGVFTYVGPAAKGRSEREYREGVVRRFDQTLAEANTSVASRHEELTSRQTSIRANHGALIASLARVAPLP